MSTIAEPFDLAPEVAAIIDDDVWDVIDPPAFAERLFTVEHLDRRELCEQLIRAVRNVESRKAALVAERDRLNAKLSAIDRRRDEVRDFLKSQMAVLGVKKIQTPIATATISPGRERIVLADNVLHHTKTWPTEVYVGAVEVKMTVRKDWLKEKFADRLKDLPGVSEEVGEDVLTIR